MSEEKGLDNTRKIWQFLFTLGCLLGLLYWGFTKHGPIETWPIWYIGATVLAALLVIKDVYSLLTNKRQQ